MNYFVMLRTSSISSLLTKFCGIQDIRHLQRLNSSIAAQKEEYDVSSNNKEEEPDKLYKTIEIEMRAHDAAVMNSYSEFAKMAANNLDITVGKCWAARKPNIDRKCLTLLRASFAKKKYRVQYEVRTYFRYATFHNMTGSTADTFLEYIERNVPEGVALKVTKVAIEKLPEELLSPLQLSDNNNRDETICNQAMH